MTIKLRFSKLGRKLWNSPLVTTWGATFSQLVGIAVILPMVIARFPADEVRFWLLLNSFAIVKMFVQLGFTNTFSRLYAYAMAGRQPEDLDLKKTPSKADKNNPNWHTVDHLNSASQRIFLFLTIAYAIIYLSFGSWIIADPIGDLENPTGAWIVWFIMGIVQPLTFFGIKYECYLTGTGLVALNQRFMALFSVLSTVSMVLVLGLGAEIYSVIIIGQLLALATFLRAYFLAKNVRPGRYRDSFFGHFSPQIWVVAWPRAWRSALGQISLNGTASVAIILLAKNLPAAEGAMYLLTLRLVSMVSQISNAPFYSKLPQLSRLRGTADLENLTKLSKKGMFLSMHIFVLGVIGLGIFGPVFFNLLEKEVGFPPLDLWLMMGAAIALQRYGSMHLQIYSTTNKIVWHQVGGISAGVMVILMILFIPRFGGIALPGSLLVGYGLIFAPWCAKLSLASLGQGFWQFEKKIGLPAAAVFIVGTCLLLSFN